MADMAATPRGSELDACNTIMRSDPKLLIPNRSNGQNRNMPADTLLAVSVGGTKLQLALVDLHDPGLVVESERCEWARTPGAGLAELIDHIVLAADRLMREHDVDAGRIAQVGVAWPGPGSEDCFAATFVPGCERPQPVGRLLSQALAESIDPRFAGIPVSVLVDAYVRAAGETAPGGAFQPGANGLLINIATGIAGALVRDGQVVLSHPRLGTAYGQFGRFLLLDHATGRWSWRPTRDGSIPPFEAHQTRWTRRGAGPALARRLARWCVHNDYRARSDELDERLRAYAETGAGRCPATERALLELVTVEGLARPDGRLAEFAAVVADEVASAVARLLEVFRGDPIDQLVLAGGVGENFMRPCAGQADAWLDRVHAGIGRPGLQVSRGALGVRAEFVGFAQPLVHEAPGEATASWGLIGA